MANEEQLMILKKGAEVWNQWREAHPDEKPDFIEANLRGINLRGTHLEGVDFRETNLIEVDLREADLTGANLAGACLKDADLRRVYLRKADLRGANLWGANLRGSHLRGADLRGANLIEVDFREADLTGANLAGAYLKDADLRRAYLRRADLRDTYLKGANLEGADLREADLREAQIEGMNLKGAYLWRAKIGVDVEGVDLREAIFEKEISESREFFPKNKQEEAKIEPLIEPPPRYADFTFFYSDRHILTGHTLKVDQWYELEVAIRTKPIGMPPEELERRSIREPKQAQNVTIMVTAEGDGFEIAEPVQTLTLPPKGDSTKNALFKVRPDHKSTNVNDLAEIRVRLYYEFNLLEVAVIRAEVVGKFDSSFQSRLGLEKPISFRQDRLEQEYIDFDNVQPRIMHIDITKKEQSFLLNFAFYNEEKRELVFTAPVHLFSTDLEDALIDVRKIWYDIAMSKTFTEQLEGDKDEFLEHIHKLAEAGRRLWGKLFKQKTKSSIYEIGEWLERHPLKQDGIIQISLAEDAADFIFPWALIYQPSPLFLEQSPMWQATPPDLNNFWGIRYCIEQKFPYITKDTDEPFQLEKELKLDFMLWDQFRNANEQKLLMQELMKRSTGKLEVSTPPIIDAKSCYNILHDCHSHILYFYTHGYTRHRQADIDIGPTLDLFLPRYESLDKDSPLRESYKLLYDSIKQDKFESDRSWIELTYGKVYLDKLNYVKNFESGPIVILNMCESAQITPSLSDGFFHFFLDRGARSVIGTECPMTVEFAHPFSEKLLQEILTGEQVGMALLHARGHFLKKFKNPLGLAYTLFGLATVAFEPPRF